jgi:hypothetical protein
MVLWGATVAKTDSRFSIIVPFMLKPSHLKGRRKFRKVEDPDSPILHRLANRFQIYFAFFLR